MTKFAQFSLFCAVLLGLDLLCCCVVLATDNDSEERRLCGRLLINALKTACNHNYFRPTEEQLRDNYYRRAKRSFPIKRGINFDCCTKKCSMRYIKTNYCASSLPSFDTNFSIEK